MSDDNAYLLYRYNPSTAAAVIYIILFIGTTLFHIYQVISKRTWYFIPFVIGGFFEILGYVGRALNSRQAYNEWSLGPYIMNSVLILLGPSFFAASIYMVLGRIIVLTDGDQYSLIRARWLTKIFVTGDVISFLMQGGGGGMLSSAKSLSDTQRGENIITGGLVVQLLFFAFFIIVAGIFHRRITKGNGGSAASGVPWQQYLMVLYIASVFIMIRCLFRIIEYAQGNDGFLLRHEAFMYVFDSTLMFIVMVIFNLRHPSAIIQGKGQEYHAAAPTGSRDGYAMEDRITSSSKYNNRRHTQEEV